MTDATEHYVNADGLGDAPPPAEPAQPQPESQTAPEPEQDLDALLAQYDITEAQRHQYEQQQRIENAQAQTQQAWEHAQSVEQQLAADRQQHYLESELREYDDYVKNFAAELKISERVVRGMLRETAAADQEAVAAWDNRRTNPRAWEFTRHRLAREYHKELASRIDEQATEDRAAVTHAIRSGASSVVPKEAAPDFGSMSDRELQNYTRKNFGF
jgi:hypothetical protein